MLRIQNISVVVLFFAFSLFAEAHNSAWELGQDFWGNPASQNAARGPFYGIETSIPGQAAQYFSAVTQDEEFGLGFQHVNDPFSNQSQRQFSMAWSLELIPQITLGARANYLSGSLVGNSQMFWDWGMRWRPMDFISLGWDQKGFSEWKGHVLPQTNYGIQFQFLENHLQGGLSWNQPGIEVPFFGNKASRRMNLDSAEVNLSTRISFLELGINGTLSEFDQKENLEYQIRVHSPQDFVGWSKGGSNDATTLSINHMDYKDPKQQDYARIAVVHFNLPISDSPSGFSLLGNGSSITINQVLLQLKEIEQHPNLKQVYLNFNGLYANWSSLREIRKAIQAIQAAGKNVTAYLTSGDFKSYYVASIANTIAIHPASYLTIMGFSSEVTLYKGFFDTLGVEAQFIRHGKYKSAVEPYTRTSLSEEAKNDISTLQSSLWQTISNDIRLSRKIDSTTFDSIVNNVQLNNQSALNRNLIDTVLYFDELFKSVRFGASDAIDFEVPPIRNNTFYNTDYIAVVYAEGSIIQGSSGVNNITGAKLIGNKTIERQLAVLAEDDRVKGVVLRVNSPGGSAWASDAMHRAVENFKESGKPIITSVGGVAASGGYYLICGTHYIFTEKTSILGSIGIFGGKFVIKDLKERFGINTEIVKTHESADSEGNHRLWTEKETTEIQAHLDDFYRDFVLKVATGRELDTALVDSLGQGRVFTGSQALENGLADQEGGLTDAIDYLKTQLNLNNSNSVRIVEYHAEDQSWLDQQIPFFFSNSQMAKQKQLYLDFSNTLMTQNYWAFSPWLSGVN